MVIGPFAHILLLVYLDSWVVSGWLPPDLDLAKFASMAVELTVHLQCFWGAWVHTALW